MTYNQYKKTDQELTRDTTEIFDTIPSLRTSQIQWAEVRYDPDDSTPNYIGMSATELATSDTGWVIFKFTYSGSNATRIQKKRGSWDNRTSLF